MVKILCIDPGWDNIGWVYLDTDLNKALGGCDNIFEKREKKPQNADIKNINLVAKLITKWWKKTRRSLSLAKKWKLDFLFLEKQLRNKVFYTALESMIITSICATEEKNLVIDGWFPRTVKSTLGISCQGTNRENKNGILQWAREKTDIFYSEITLTNHHIADALGLLVTAQLKGYKFDNLQLPFQLHFLSSMSNRNNRNGSPPKPANSTNVHPPNKIINGRSSKQNGDAGNCSTIPAKFPNGSSIPSNIMDYSKAAEDDENNSPTSYQTEAAEYVRNHRTRVYPDVPGKSERYNNEFGNGGDADMDESGADLHNEKGNMVSPLPSDSTCPNCAYLVRVRTSGDHTRNAGRQFYSCKRCEENFKEKGIRKKYFWWADEVSFDGNGETILPSGFVKGGFKKTSRSPPPKVEDGQQNKRQKVLVDMEAFEKMIQNPEIEVDAPAGLNINHVMLSRLLFKNLEFMTLLNDQLVELNTNIKILKR